MNARYVHTNLVARDWRRLARFYHEVFGCQPVPPERDLSGPWLEDATGVPGVRIRGIHLRLPGHGKKGPTLEIFEYEPSVERPVSAPNRPGFGHVAFAVDQVGVPVMLWSRPGAEPLASLLTFRFPARAPLPLSMPPTQRATSWNCNPGRRGASSGDHQALGRDCRGGVDC